METLEEKNLGLEESNVFLKEDYLKSMEIIENLEKDLDLLKKSNQNPVVEPEPSQSSEKQKLHEDHEQTIQKLNEVNKLNLEKKDKQITMLINNFTT